MARGVEMQLSRVFAEVAIRGVRDMMLVLVLVLALSVLALCRFLVPQREDKIAGDSFFFQSIFQYFKKWYFLPRQKGGKYRSPGRLICCICWTWSLAVRRGLIHNSRL